MVGKFSAVETFSSKNAKLWAQKTPYKILKNITFSTHNLLCRKFAVLVDKPQFDARLDFTHDAAE